MANIEVVISTKKENYLTKKYGNAQAIVQQVFDSWFKNEINAEYDKKVKVDTNKKMEELDKLLK